MAYNDASGSGSVNYTGYNPSGTWCTCSISDRVTVTRSGTTVYVSFSGTISYSANSNNYNLGRFCRVVVYVNGVAKSSQYNPNFDERAPGTASVSRSFSGSYSCTDAKAGTIKVSVTAGISESEGNNYTLDNSVNYSVADCTITYNANGGTGTTNSQTVTYGNSITVSSCSFTKSGCRFVKWNTSSNGNGTSYSPGALITPTENITLYAIWQTLYTVTYNANGGTGTTNSQTIDAGASVTFSSCYFIKSNYGFVKWNTSSDGSGTSYSSGESIILTKSLTLYAIWQSISLSLRENGCCWARFSLNTINYDDNLWVTATNTSSNAMATLDGANSNYYVNLDTNTKDFLIAGLSQGTSYRINVYKKTASGSFSSAGTMSLTFTTNKYIDIYVFDGSAWQPGAVYVYNGSSWVEGVPDILVGNSWWF